MGPFFPKGWGQGTLWGSGPLWFCSDTRKAGLGSLRGQTENHDLGSVLYFEAPKHASAQAEFKSRPQLLPFVYGYFFAFRRLSSSCVMHRGRIVSIQRGPTGGSSWHMMFTRLCIVRVWYKVVPWAILFGAGAHTRSIADVSGPHKNYFFATHLFGKKHDCTTLALFSCSRYATVLSPKTVQKVRP